jgi:hypothetical protein
VETTGEIHIVVFDTGTWQAATNDIFSDRPDGCDQSFQLPIVLDAYHFPSPF